MKSSLQSNSWIVIYTILFFSQLSEGASLRRILQVHWPTTLFSSSPKIETNNCLQVATIDTHSIQFSHLRGILNGQISKNNNPFISVLKQKILQGQTFDDAFMDLKIPKKWYKYFNTETGDFDYFRTDPLVLSSDNGRQGARAIRINFEARHTENYILSFLANVLVKTSQVSRQLVFDFRTVLTRISDLELYIAVRPDELAKVEKLVKRYPSKLRNRVHITPINFARSRNVYGNAVWANDGSKPIHANELATLVQSDGNRVRRPVYNEITSALSQATSLNTTQSLFRFEGGNVLVGDRHVFVGPDIVNGVVEELKISYSEAVRALGIEFGKPIAVVGSPDNKGKMRQTTYHIDLSMMIARNPKKIDEEIAFVESPNSFFKEFLNFSENDLASSGNFVDAVQNFVRKYRQERTKLTKPEREFLLNLHEIEFSKLSYKNFASQSSHRALNNRDTMSSAFQD